MEPFQTTRKGVVRVGSFAAMAMASESHSSDRPLKDGERLLAPSRRPDGTLRKPIRIRAGYTPQDEVAIYQSKGAIFRKGQPTLPPGYDPVDDVPQMPKTKSAKRNQKRKEKRQQLEAASLGTNGDIAQPSSLHESIDAGSQAEEREEIESVTERVNSLSIENVPLAKPCEEPWISSDKINLEKRIRALRKKIREAESLQASMGSRGALNAEQSAKLAKLDAWRTELNELESKSAI